MSSGKLIVIKYNQKTPDGYFRFDCTSKNEQFKRYASPFFLGPVQCYDELVSKNVENAWQYSKVYNDMVDENGEPDVRFNIFRDNGFKQQRASRHPHSGKPLYSYWDGNKYGYIEARKNIYIPLYANAVLNNSNLVQVIRERLKTMNIAIADFDGYNHKSLRMTYNDVINCESKIMGHGHVLAMLVEEPDTIREYLREGDRDKC